LRTTDVPYVGIKKGSAAVVNVWAVPGTLRYGTGGDDLEEMGGNCGDWTPNLRNGVDKRGECVVIPNDTTAYTRTLAVLLALRSGLGVGNVTVYVDGVAVAWHALLKVDFFGAFCQRVRLRWEGTVES
jgi:hypothetical protein